MATAWPTAEGVIEMATSPDIAVVGAGFSGLALVASLQRLGYGGRIALIGTPTEFGSGYAYSTGVGNYLLNSRADRMGLHGDNPGGFADWLGLEGSSRAGFAARSVYGALARAEAWDVTAAPELRLAARQLAERLAADAGKASPATATSSTISE